MKRLSFILFMLVCAISSWPQEKIYENSVEFSYEGKWSSFGNEKNTLDNWMSSNLRYPQEAIEKREQGVVEVGFVVEKDGSLSSIEIKKSVSQSLDAEALRLASTMPKWNCAYYYGVPCRTRNFFSVTFKLPEVKKDSTEGVYSIYSVKDRVKTTFLRLDKDGSVYFKYEGKCLGKEYHNDEYVYWGKWVIKRGISKIEPEDGYLTDVVHRSTNSTAIQLKQDMNNIKRWLFIYFPCYELIEDMQSYSSLVIDLNDGRIYGGRCSSSLQTIKIK